MTAGIKLGGNREGKQQMKVQDENKNLENSPVEPDEGWWSSVLADEPSADMPNVPVDIEPVAKHPSGGTEQVHSSVNWSKVEALFSNDEIIRLNAVGYNRGGILVAGEDIHGFVPASHLIDLPSDLSEDEREQYLTSYLDRKIPLKVIECEPEKDRVVFSERAALAGEGQRKQLLNNLSEGDIVTGVVTNVTSFGVFVDLGGLEGLIHVSELSWGRVQHPSNILNVDNEIKTLVLQILEDEGRIALSLKRLENNPWQILSEKLTPGDIVDAVISSIVKYGAFARLAEGIEGLIHISSMNFPQGCTHIEDFLYEGHPVKVRVLNIDPQKRRLGLSLESYSTE